MSTRKLIRETRRMVESIGCRWGGCAFQGNDHLRVTVIAPDGREAGITMSSTPGSEHRTLSITRSRIRQHMRAGER